MTNIRNEAITTDFMGIKRNRKEYYEQLYAPKFDVLDEMDRFLKRQTLPKLIQGEEIG